MKRYSDKLGQFNTTPFSNAKNGVEVAGVSSQFIHITINLEPSGGQEHLLNWMYISHSSLQDKTLAIY